MTIDEKIETELFESIKSEIQALKADNEAIHEKAMKFEGLLREAVAENERLKKDLDEALRFLVLKKHDPILFHSQKRDFLKKHGR